MKKNSVFKVLIPVAAILLCGIVVLLERNGVTQKYITQGKTEGDIAFSQAVSTENKCLMLTNATDEASPVYEAMMEIVLDEMRVGYDKLEVGEDTDFSQLDGYDTMVITFEDWSVLGQNLLTISDWVNAGGNLMNTTTPTPNSSLAAVSGKIGIDSGGTGYTAITGFQMLQDCMIGAKEGESFTYMMDDTDEALEISLSVELNKNCEVFMKSDDGKVPLLWRCPYGEGNFVILNESLADRYQRGFLCLAYSLMQDACIYPVINGSAFYLDDFPSPVPDGNSEYIKRDYGISIASFYSTIWWPKQLEWESKYNIKHTGLIIEEYSDDVSAPFERNLATAQFITYGNMLLNNGGELGFHGYNHMPLCIAGVDEAKQYGEYELWDSVTDVKLSLTELQEFSENLFPETTFAVYVPPSNIMSETGKQALLEACPDIKVIASTYLPDGEDAAYIQEFGVDEDGIIHTPRITSGCNLDVYQKLSALSELNFHYVQSHFMHPDDVLDEDRGAALGWEKLTEEFDTYLDWVYTSAPNIRNVTGSEMGTAVLQYDSLSLDRKLEDGVLTVNLGGFSEEAYFMLRINEGTVDGTEGCDYEHITGNLYLVHALEDEIKIYLGE